MDMKYKIFKQFVAPLLIMIIVVMISLFFLSANDDIPSSSATGQLLYFIPVYPRIKSIQS